MSGHYTDKETITRVEFLALQQLLWLARRKRQQAQELIFEIRELTGEEAKIPNDPMGGHSYDALWDDYTAEDLLQKLDLRVEDPKQPEEPQS